MPFVCTLSGDSFTGLVVQRGSSRIVTARIGLDEETDTIYSLLVGLDPSAGGDHELIFTVIAAYSDGTERAFWSGQETADILRGEDRGKVLAAIAGCVENLVRVVQPLRVFMCTHEANLPERALEKYHRIALAIEMCGYTVSRPDSFHGQIIWFMEPRVAASR